MKKAFGLGLIFLLLLAVGVQAQDQALAPPEVLGEAVYIPFPVDITLDGDLSDWANVPRVTVDRGTMLSDDPANNGSFTFALAASADTLYMFDDFGGRQHRHGAARHQTTGMRIRWSSTSTSATT